MKLSDAVNGNIYEPAPPPTDFPPETTGPGLEPLADDEPAEVEDQDPGGWLYLGEAPAEEERGVVTTGVDPGPVGQPVTTGVDDNPSTSIGVVRHIVATGSRDAVAAGRTALGVSRAIGDRVLAGVPTVDDLAHKGAHKATKAAAGAAKGGLLANNWARFGKYRSRWEA